MTQVVEILGSNFWWKICHAWLPENMSEWRIALDAPVAAEQLLDVVLKEVLVHLLSNITWLSQTAKKVYMRIWPAFLHHNHYCHRDGQTRFPAVSSSMASLLTPWNMRQSFSSSETFISLLLEWWASYTKKTESHQRKWQRKNLSWVFRPRKRLASTRALLGQELLHRAGHHCHLPLVHYWTWHLLYRVFPERCFCP